MNANSWFAAKQLFGAVVDAAPQDRARLLADASIDDETRALVESMLRVDADPGRTTIDPAISQLGALESDADRRLEGTCFGEYRILGLLGRGGMGVVYLAEREHDGAVQRVALKLIRSTGFGAETLRRFHLERRLLARLNHSGIARLIDLGCIDGHPYFAMEFVDGEPLLSYCDSHRSGLRDRLLMIRQICDAVAHAHRSLVVHRDVKPSNVLVDPDGWPRLLDFGIAKALDPGFDSPLEQTRTHNRFISPQCTPPEMLRDEPITTACDVYALGALTYELLAGCPPFEFASGRLSDIEAAILEQIPARPSERVAALHPERARQVALDRGFVSANALKNRLRGDLDTVVLRALAKEPSRRYASADALAEDLDRHLGNLPLHARPDTLRYRAGKFICRNRWPVAVTATGVVATVVVVALIWVQSQRIAVERDVALAERAHAERVSEFLVDTFSMADPTHTLGDQISARQILDQAMLRLEAEPDGQGAGRTRILSTMAQAYVGLGRYEDALSVAQRALRAAGDDDERFLAHRLMADVLNGAGSFEAALEHAQSAFALRNDDAARASLAPVLANLGRTHEAEALYRERLADLSRPDADPVTVAAATVQLARHLRNVRRHDEARSLFERGLTLQRAALPDNHPAVAETLAGLGSVERALGNTDVALALIQESLSVHQRVYGNEHPVVGRAWGSLGNALAAAGRYQEAIEAMERALAMISRFHGEQSAMAAMVHYNIGRIHQSNLRDPVRAEPHFRSAIAAAQASGSSSNLPFFQLGLAAALNSLSRQTEALAILEPVYRDVVARDGADTLNAAYLENELAESMRRSGRFDASEQLLDHAIPLFEERLGEAHTTTRTARYRLAAARARDDRPLVPPDPVNGD